ncbi:unnamed protein product [Candidula unifasciata]|uniref:Uncharacterized protein n=1 Tax=Candidula unifasciata TaxID=100452 RepID=A0A8S3Z7S5_9EUPU|nr:unnamed protein product [Candidula unifasciata]
MMDQIHLVGEEEDDYAGFNDYNAALDTEDLVHDETFQKAVLRTSHGRRPPVSTTLATAARGRMALSSSMGRPGSGIAIQAGQARPMTAVRAAGFTSAGNRRKLLWCFLFVPGLLYQDIHNWFVCAYSCCTMIFRNSLFVLELLYHDIHKWLVCAWAVVP